MPFRYYTLGTILFSFIAMGIMKLIPSSRKRAVTRNSECDSAALEANVNAMKRVVAEHEDFTAEVISFGIYSRRQVEIFRRVSPGERVELARKKGKINVYAFGEYIGELLIPADSNLLRLFDKKIPFEAYLGGRDRSLIYESNFDACSIIVFYKLDGVLPTKVNLA